MRTLTLCCTLLIGLVAAPAAASAFTWSESSPLALESPILATVPRADGSTLIAAGRQARPGQGPGTLTLQRIGADGDVVVATALSELLVVAQRPAPTGGVDLLVLEHSSRARNTTGTLALLRMTTALKARRVWSADGATSLADFGRSTLGGYAIAWHDRAGLHVVTSRDGTTFTQPKLVKGAAPRTEVGPPLVTDLGVGVGHGGDALVALTTNASPGRVSLLDISRQGRIERRQETKGVEGRVQVEQTRGGRMGVLVHDTGVSGEAGECVSDGQPRRVWATTAEARTGRFRPLRKLNEQVAYCEDGGAPLLVAGPGETLSAVWGAQPSGEAAVPSVHVAQAGPNAGFPAGGEAWPGYVFGTAAATDPSGGLDVVLRHPDVQLGHGLLVARRAPDATSEPPQELTPDGSGASLAVDAAGKAHATWATATGDQVLALGTP
jgi:hypothetical protein